jgi:hypothetical protein
VVSLEYVHSSDGYTGSKKFPSSLKLIRLVKLLNEFGTVPVKELELSQRTLNEVRDPMEEGRGPLKELVWRER